MPPEEKDTFHDITSAVDFQPSAEFPLLLVLVIGVVVLILFIALLILVKRNKKTTTLTPHVIKDALAVIPSLREASTEQSAQKSATELSALVRQTLSKVTDNPTLFQSQQEFDQQGQFWIKDPVLMKGFQDHLHYLWNLEYSQPNEKSRLPTTCYDSTEALLNHLNTYYQ